MPLGIEGSWVDGHEAYVLVRAADATSVAERFGELVRWWPREMADAYDDPWLRYPQHGPEYEVFRRRIVAFVTREPELQCVLVQSGRSNGSPWTEADDYVAPMYEDAITAMRHGVPTGPELYETPVRIAARLSRELSTVAVALWGSDEAAALQGLGLWDGGEPIWAASAYSLQEIEAAYEAYVAEDDDEDEGEWSEGDPFYLSRPGRAVESVAEPLHEWAQARLSELGLGLDLSSSPHNTHPYEVLSRGGAGLADFVIAVSQP